MRQENWLKIKRLSGRPWEWHFVKDLLHNDLDHRQHLFKKKMKEIIMLYNNYCTVIKWSEKKKKFMKTDIIFQYGQNTFNLKAGCVK